jgi:hypothetical protein
VRRVAWCVVLGALAPECAGGSLSSSTPTLSATAESPQPEMTSIELGDLRSWQSPLDVAVGADAVWVTVQDLGLVRVDPATNRVVATIPGDYFFRVSVGPDAV